MSIFSDLFLVHLKPTTTTITIITYGINANFSSFNWRINKNLEQKMRTLRNKKTKWKIIRKEWEWGMPKQKNTKADWRKHTQFRLADQNPFQSSLNESRMLK